MTKQYRLDSDNKINVSNVVIVLLSVYMVWQMGVLFYSGGTLSIGGRTPIPVTEPYTAAIIAAGYAVTITFHLLFYRLTVIFGKIAVVASLTASAVLFTKASPQVLAAAFYVTAFCCTFLIGTTYSIEAGLYRNDTVLKSNLLTTLIGCILIAVIQNDFFKLSFLAFNIISVIMLVMLFVGYCLLPKTVDTPRISVKTAAAQNELPIKMLLGLYLSPFVSTLLLVFSSVVAETVKHGIFIFYVCGAVSTVFWIIVYKKYKVSPFKISTAAFALSILGFVFAALSIIYKPLIYPAIVLTGGNILVANMIGFFANTAFVYRPTRTAGTGLTIIGFIIATLQIGLLELFRSNLTALFAVMSVVALLFIIFCILVEPQLSYRFKALQAEQKPQKNPPGLCRQSRKPPFPPRY